MAITIALSDVDRTQYCLTDTLTISDEANSRNTCTFDMENATFDWEVPELGTKIVIRDSGNGNPGGLGVGEVVFGGTIDNIDKWTPLGTQVQFYRISGIDYNQLCDRRLVNEIFSNQTSGSCINVLLSNKYLGKEGVTGTPSTIISGPIMKRLVFQWVTIADCLNELARLTTFRWNIDYYKVMHWYDRTTNVAPFAITPTASFRNLKITRTREGYVNKQRVRGATRETSEVKRVDIISTAGTRVYPLKYALGSTAPSIWVDTVEQIVGPPTLIGAEWNFTAGEMQVSLADTTATPAAGSAIRIDYIGVFPILICKEDSAQILERKDVEGGSGFYEGIENNESIKTEDQATQTAAALIRLYGKLPTILEFETDEPGFLSGQNLRVRLLDYGLYGPTPVDYKEMNIFSVQAKDIGGQFLRYQVRAVGSEAPSWIAFFGNLAKPATQMVYRENETLLDMRGVNEKTLCYETIVFGTSLPYVGFSLVGSSEVMALRWDESQGLDEAIEVGDESQVVSDDAILFWSMLFGPPTG